MWALVLVKIPIQPSSQNWPTECKGLVSVGRICATLDDGGKDGWVMGSVVVRVDTNCDPSGWWTMVG